MRVYQIQDPEIEDDLEKWKVVLDLNDEEVKAIKRHIFEMKMDEFETLVGNYLKDKKGNPIEPWFSLDNFTPVTCAIYYFNFRPVEYVCMKIWKLKDYSSRSRTTKILEGMPKQQIPFAKKYIFTHNEKQGKPCENYKYWKKKRKAMKIKPLFKTKEDDLDGATVSK